MSNYRRNMKQTATYWAPDAPDGFGNVGFGAPVQVACRWQDKAELFRDSSAREVTSSSVVYTETPVEITGYLFLGSSLAADPTDVEGAKEVRQIGATPNLRNSQTLNKAWL